MSIIRKEQLTNPLSASYALTASYALSANVAFNTSSLLTTASATSNVITFTKGDTTQFSITVDTGSTATVNTGSLLVTASATLNNIQFTKGDGSTFNIIINTGSAAAVDTSSLVTTSSFNAFTSSINTFTASYNTGSFSGSFTGSLNGTASTASYYQETDPVFTAVSGTFVTTSSFNSFTSSIHNFTSSYNTGSFTGSFSGSFYGTSSWATNASTSSYYQETDPIFVTKSASLATTGSNNFKGNQNITGSTTITGSLLVNNGLYDIISSTNEAIFNSNGSASISWGNRILYASDGTTPSLNWSSNLVTTSETFFTTTISNTSLEEFSSTSNYAGIVISRVSIDGNVAPYDVVYLDIDGTWYQNNQSTAASSKKLGIYLDNNLILTEGHIVVDNAGIIGPAVQAREIGVPIFIRDGGGISMSCNSPTVGYVRILGHIYYQNQNTDTNLYIMRFNPSNDYYLLG